MDNAQFESMVSRLEQESAAAPGRYKFKVALLATAGFGILALIVAISGLGILLLVAITVAAVVSGGKAILLMLKLGKFLLLLAVPLWFLVKSSMQALFTRLPAPSGREITRAEAPALFAAMDDLRARLQGPRFHHVLITDDLNAAVVQRPLFGLFGFPRNYLLLGLPLLESLSADEALAVVAHEYGHLSGAHARFGAFIYRLRNTWGTIQQIAGQWQGAAGRLLRKVIEAYAPYFNAYTFVLARANEYHADAASAELVSPAVAANALKRVNIASAQYRQFFDQVFAAARLQPAPPEDVAERWSQHAVIAPPEPIATRWLAESLVREKSAFDTHPVLRDRLRALPNQADTMEVAPEPLRTSSAAQSWLGRDAAPLRSELQFAWREQVAPYWQSLHERAQVQSRRLRELQDLATPTIDEQAECLQLLVALEPAQEHLPAVVSFNEQHPDRPQMLFLEGTLRLDRDDEQGIPRLERAMQIDTMAIKPACERLYDFLMRRGQAERAKSYGERWQERHQWELARNEQLETLDLRHELRAPDLDEDTMEFVRRNLAVNSEGVARAWIARRVIPADESAATYVIGLEIGWWARLWSKGPEAVQRIASIEWPMHLFVCTLDGANKNLKKRVKVLAGALVYQR